MFTKRLSVTFILVVIALTTIYVDCDKYPGYAPTYKYAFKANVSLSPYALNYHVGDTIWLSVNLPGKLLSDTISNTTIHYDSADFNCNATAQLVYHNPFITDGPFVSFIFPDNITGATSNYSGFTVANLSFGCSPSADYSTRLGMILLQKGAFDISFVCNNITRCFTAAGGDAQMQFVLDVPDTHLDFYQQLPLDSIGLTEDENVVLDLQKKRGIAIHVE